MNQAAAMTDFKLPTTPDPKEPVSVRMPTSLKERVKWVVELWREVAKAKGSSAAVVEAIDFPYVLLQLLQGRADAEIQELSKGFPTTDEQRKALLKEVREATLAQTSKKR